MNPAPRTGATAASTCDFAGDATGIIAYAVVDLQRRWIRGEGARVEDYLTRFPHLRRRVDSVVDLAFLEFATREALGHSPGFDEYEQRFPEHAVALRERFAAYSELSASDGAARDTPPAAGPETFHQPLRADFETPTRHQPPASWPVREAVAPPAARFRVLRRHAKGGLGQVSVA